MEDGKTRNWATIVYPESAEADWKEKLEELHIMAYISPLHNLDVTEDGEIKKAHHHVILMFDGVKSRKQVSKIFESIGGVGIERVQSIRAYARYLCHLDDTEKTKYAIEDVISLSGANYLSQMSQPADKYAAIGEMLDYCIERKITSFATLLLYARDNRDDWFRVLCSSGSITVLNFLKSRTWEDKTYNENKTQS